MNKKNFRFICQISPITPEVADHIVKNGKCAYVQVSSDEFNL